MSNVPQDPPPSNWRIGSLFSGIDGLSLGLERAGLGRTVWQVEQNTYCRTVLAARFPEATRHDDVRDVGARNLSPVEVLCGGFPCQNLSSANVATRFGLSGPSSGLWSEFSRIVSEVRPRVVVVENVANGWREWVPAVRGDLHAAGYSSVCFRLRATGLGAAHDRSRCFVVAHAYRDGEPVVAVHAEMEILRRAAIAAWEDRRSPPPGTLGVPDGVPDRMGQLHAYGNAVMPQMSHAVGLAIRAMGWV